MARLAGRSYKNPLHILPAQHGIDGFQPFRAFGMPFPRQMIQVPFILYNSCLTHSDDPFT